MTNRALPPWAVEAILPTIGVRLGSLVLDPFCRTGEVLSALSSSGALRAGYIQDKETLAALRKFRAAFLLPRDPFSDRPWNEMGSFPTHAICRPPLEVADRLVVRAVYEVMHQGGGVVALLLPLSFMATKSRRRLHADYPSDVHVLSRRINAKAMIDMAWFVWHHAASYRWSVLDVAAPEGRRENKRST